MLQESYPVGETPALSIVILRRDEQCSLHHTRERSALRQVREMEHLAVRQELAPHENEPHLNTRRETSFIDDERAFDDGDVLIED